jgi:uncharacterized membrane protein
MQRPSFAINRSLFAIWCLLGVLASLGACSKQTRYPAAPIEGDSVVIQLAPIPPEVPQFYSYRSQGKEIHFFIIRMHNRVLSFLDACLSCYPRKLGYASKDGSVVCRACDTTYSIYTLEKGLGGCFPIKIEGKQEDGKYVIARSALDRHAGKF